MNIEGRGPWRAGRRKSVNELVMHAQPESGPADTCQRDIIAGQIDPFESVALFEIAEAAALLLSISEIRIDQMRDSPIGTGSNRLRNECICRCFIPVSDHRDDVHHAGLSSVVIGRQFDETYQFLVEIGADKMLVSRNVELIWRT